MASFKERMEAIARSGSKNLTIKIPTSETQLVLHNDPSSPKAESVESADVDDEDEGVKLDVDEEARHKLKRRISITPGFYAPRFVEDGDPMMDDQKLTTFKFPRNVEPSGMTTLSLGGPSTGTSSASWFEEATTPLKDSFDSQKGWWKLLPNKQVPSAQRLRAATSDDQPRKTFLVKQNYALADDKTQNSQKVLPLTPSSRIWGTGKGSVAPPSSSPSFTKNIFSASPGTTLATIEENQRSPDQPSSASSKRHILYPRRSSQRRLNLQKKDSASNELMKGQANSLHQTLGHYNEHSNYGNAIDPSSSLAQERPKADPFFDESDIGGAKYVQRTTMFTKLVEHSEQHGNSDLKDVDIADKVANELLLSYSSKTGVNEPQGITNQYGFASSVPPLRQEQATSQNRNILPGLYQSTPIRESYKLPTQTVQNKGNSSDELNVENVFEEMQKHPHLTVEDFLARYKQVRPRQHAGSSQVLVASQAMENTRNNGTPMKHLAHANNNREGPPPARWYLFQDYSTPASGLDTANDNRAPVWTQQSSNKNFRYRLVQGASYLEGIPNAFTILGSMNPPVYQLPFGSIVFGIKVDQDVHIRSSVQNALWSSNAQGNRDLQEAWGSRRIGAKLMLLFSVVGSGKFCGLAEIWAPFDPAAKAQMMTEGETQGAFPIRWIYCKDVPLSLFSKLRDSASGRYMITFREVTPFPEMVGRKAVQIYVEAPHITNILAIDKYEGSAYQSPSGPKNRTPRRRSSFGQARTPSSTFDHRATPGSYHTASATPYVSSPFNPQPYLEGSAPGSARSIQQFASPQRLGDQSGGKRNTRKMSYASPGRKAGLTAKTFQPSQFGNRKP